MRGDFPADTAAIQYSEYDPEGDLQALRELAWECEQFSPCVGLEQGEQPECLFLDLTGCELIFGSEEQLAVDLLTAMRHRDYEVRLAIAPTLGAAWAIAHHLPPQTPYCIVSADRLLSRVRPLPVRLLRLPEAIITTLNDLGLRTIGHLLKVPRDTLPARFGKELRLRLDQLQGIVPETFPPERRPEPIEVLWQTEHPVNAQAVLEELLGRQLHKILEKLTPLGQGIQELICLLRSPEMAVPEFRIELIRPTQSAAHLLELLSLQWERRPLPEEVAEIRLIARQTAAMRSRSVGLFDMDQEFDHAALTTLIERLSSRLGLEAVLKVKFVPEEQPELAVQYVPALKQLNGNSFKLSSPLERKQTGDLNVSSPIEGRGWVRGELCEAPPQSGHLKRPLWLKRPPVPISVTLQKANSCPQMIQYHGSQHTIHFSWGPERITTGWWRHEHVRRDYYHIETTHGYHFWIYHDLNTDQWSLHGVFD